MVSKYLILYKGDATDPADMAEEDRNKIMQAWAAWMENVGSALVDVGAPTGPSTSIVDDGSNGDAALITGYSIIQADSMDAAKELCKDHPFLSDGEGKFAIDIFEMMPVPEMG